MKKMSTKLILASALIALLSTMIPRLLLRFVYGDIFPDYHSAEIVDTEPFFIGGLLSVGISISLFVWFVNRVIVKRVKKLNEATKEVSTGNYDFEIKYDQNDELSELSKNFNLMLRELKSNEYLNKEFIRNFTHEFKTPISAIKGYSDLLATIELTDEEKARYLNIISTESARLANLSSNMLNISLIDSKSIIEMKDTYDLAEQIRNIIQLQQLEWEKKKLKFVMDLSELKILSNKEFTYQVWSNLIGNAIKYSNFGSDILIDLSSNTDGVKFTITTVGEYLDAETQEKIFNLFYVHSKESKGTGVGLTLTRKIVEKLGGTVLFVSSPEGVNTFTVNIPN